MNNNIRLMIIIITTTIITMVVMMVLMIIMVIKILGYEWWAEIKVKAAAADMRYLGRSKSSRSLVYKKKFGLTRQVVFKSEYLFWRRR